MSNSPLGLLKIVVVVWCFPVCFAQCLCNSPDLCSTPLKKHTREIIAFAIGREDGWKKWNWTEITTIIAVDNLDSAKELYCYAHSKQVRVTSLVRADVNKLTQHAYRKQLLDSWLDTVKKYSLDGLNLDIEGNAFNKTLVDAITAITKETHHALKNFSSSLTISFDAPHSPNVGGGRGYDFAAIAKYTDYIIVMDYDAMDSGIFASANSPYDVIAKSYPLFTNELAIPSHKLVMAVPWYGYNFECATFINNSNENWCVLSQSKRQELLTFANGSKLFNKNWSLTYAGMMKVLSGNTVQGGLKWDKKSASPYFTTMENGTYHQYWFDNVQSLKLKYQLALKLKLGGLCMWHTAMLDYDSTDKKVKARTTAMWDTISEYARALKQL
ncbi:di-N-acetylchitobiase-like [Clavelina lepadiformis]|uniref:di-N-acetylchitobiase-like n=1 Tax=Clavelina lepadiformis TaxID=159417 RepID=UPI004041C7E7